MFLIFIDTPFGSKVFKTLQGFAVGKIQNKTANKPSFILSLGLSNLNVFLSKSNATLHKLVGHRLISQK